MDVDFEDFVRSSSPSLQRAAWLLVGDRGHAEDLVQSVYERVAAKWSRARRKPAAYAHRCLVNLAIDRHRAKAARVEELPLVADAHRFAVGAGTGQIEDRAELVQALRTLPERQRSVLVLRYFLDLDEAATAAALGVGVGTVKSSASRALAALREHLGEEPS